MLFRLLGLRRGDLGRSRRGGGLLLLGEALDLGGPRQTPPSRPRRRRPRLSFSSVTGGGSSKLTGSGVFSSTGGAANLANAASNGSTSATTSVTSTLLLGLSGQLDRRNTDPPDYLITRIRGTLHAIDRLDIHDLREIRHGPPATAFAGAPLLPPPPGCPDADGAV